jgi:hypothetical protein
MSYQEYVFVLSWSLTLPIKTVVVSGRMIDYFVVLSTCPDAKKWRQNPCLYTACQCMESKLACVCLFFLESKM